MTPAPEQEQYGYGVASQTGLDPVEKITGLYNEFLGRAPDAEGLDYWTNAYTRGDTSLNDIRQSFMGSPEYAQRMESINAPQTPSSPLDYLVNPPDVNYPTVDSGYGYLNPPDVATQPPYFTTLPLDPSQADYSRFLNPPEVARPSEEDFYYSRFLNPPEVARPSEEDFYYSTFLNPPDVAKPPPPPPVQTTFPQLPITIEPSTRVIPPGFDTRMRDEYGNIIGYRDPARRTTPMPPVPSTGPIPAGYYLDESGNVLPITSRPSRVAPNPVSTGLDLLGTLFPKRPR